MVIEKYENMGMGSSRKNSGGDRGISTKNSIIRLREDSMRKAVRGGSKMRERVRTPK